MPTVPAEETTALLSQNDERKTKRRIRITICAIALGSFLAAFDLTVIASIYPSIGSDFNAQNQTSYIATAYLLSNTALQPLYGRLSDIYGRKQALLFANTVFLFGTIGCAIAPSLWTLVIARGIAGIGGGGLNVVGVVIMSDLVPLRSRGIYQGIMNIVFGTGSTLGAPIGGILADSIGWRWGFGVQVPLCLLSLTMVYNFINLERPASSTAQSAKEKLARIDFIGAILLVSAVTCLILGLNIGGNTAPWTDPLPIALMSAFAVLMIAFITCERLYAAEPIMPTTLLSRRTPLLTSLANFFSTAGYFVVIFNLPLFYRAAMNATAAQAGRRLIPGAISGSIGSLSIGLLMARTGRYKIFMVASAAVLLLCAVLVHSLQSDSSLLAQYLYVVPGGLGYGGFLTTTLIALLASIEAEEMASATGTSYLFRSTGSIVGISGSASILNSLLSRRLEEYLDIDLTKAIKHDVNAVWRLTGALRDKVVDTYVSCMHDVLMLSVVLAVVTLAIALFVPEHKLTRFKPNVANEGDD